MRNNDGKESYRMNDIADVSGFMIDMDGTVYKGGSVIPGAQDFIKRVKERNIPFVFLTNNSSSNREHYFNKLRKMGFDVSIDDILTSTTATIRYIKKYHGNETVYPVGTEKFVKEIEEAGVTTDNEHPDIVLLSFDTSMTYEKMNNAYRFLMNGSAFIATHPDDLCPTEDGYDIDIGPFIRFFESMTGTKATVIGKPNPLMTEMAADKMNILPEKMVMIGDRIYTDMKLAENSKIRSILVLSGEAKRSDLKDLGVKATMVVDSVDELLRN
ncbi:MAG: HAD-IIA family hydrolase [Methanomassiliicoccaceae archaeon]|nr:HAD-IIA family hydrolase [Methanomassiliicoccaceae archaeon]